MPCKRCPPRAVNADRARSLPCGTCACALLVVLRLLARPPPLSPRCGSGGRPRRTRTASGTWHRSGLRVTGPCSRCDRGERMPMPARARVCACCWSLGVWVTTRFSASRARLALEHHITQGARCVLTVCALWGQMPHRDTRAHHMRAPALSHPRVGVRAHSQPRRHWCVWHCTVLANWRGRWGHGYRI